MNCKNRCKYPILYEFAEGMGRKTLFKIAALAMEKKATVIDAVSFTDASDLIGNYG